MDLNIVTVLSFTAYKICSLAAGTTLGFLGYRLFVRGIWGDAGSITASYKNTQLLLRGAAPGTFLIVFGAAVIGFAVFKGFDVQYPFGGSAITARVPKLPEAH